MRPSTQLVRPLIQRWPFVAVGALLSLCVAWTLVLIPSSPGKFLVAERQADPSRGEGTGFLAIVRIHRGGVAWFESICAGCGFCYYFASEENSEPLLPGLTPESFAPRFARRALLPWADNPALWPKNENAEFRHVTACGWPFLSLWCEVDTSHPLSPLQAKGGGFVIGSGLQSKVLPLRPIWSGLLANAALYGVALMGIAIVPRQIRRAARGRCGRCRGCAYNLRGTPRESRCPQYDCLPTVTLQRHTASAATGQ